MYDAAPLMCGITVVVVLIFTGVTFKSVLVPIRSILTIALTLAFTYGITSLIYGVSSYKLFPGVLTPSFP